MRTIEDIQNHMQLCIGYAEQDGWLSKEPVVRDDMGFLYIIHDTLQNRFYCGMKLFWFKRLRMVQGKKRRTTKESDWRTYYGSSEDLTAAMAEHGKEHFERYILSTWETKRSLMNEECNLLHKLDVLTSCKDDGSYWFYNKFIGKTYRYDGHTKEVNKKNARLLSKDAERD